MKEQKKTNQTEENIVQYLDQLRHDDQTAIQLVKMLEPNSYDCSKHDLSFCQLYTIKLIQSYCKDFVDESKRGIKHLFESQDQIELLLVSWGLLSGYEFTADGYEARMLKYFKFVKANNYYNQLMRKTWKSPGSQLTRTRDALEKIKKNLTAEILSALAAKSTNKLSSDNIDLGLIGEIQNEPLVLPEPYIPNNPNLDQQNVSPLKSQVDESRAVIDGLNHLLSMIFDNFGKCIILFLVLCVFILVSAYSISYIIQTIMGWCYTFQGYPVARESVQESATWPERAFSGFFAGENNTYIINNNYYFQDHP